MHDLSSCIETRVVNFLWWLPETEVFFLDDWNAAKLSELSRLGWMHSEHEFVYQQLASSSCRSCDFRETRWILDAPTDVIASHEHSRSPAPTAVTLSFTPHCSTAGMGTFTASMFHHSGGYSPGGAFEHRSISASTASPGVEHKRHELHTSTPRWVPLTSGD